ncbi:hypothetical protein HMPREF9370_2149 [Neisseria wadsworthii 9715]|uniref:Uncharacterized protein n=1 Tax=Neisseria wadsworthii 9715 TaxID=1030841 RepID=G4CSR7_9NEIS|nr:hypothetical protein HMPREF9370_2149 [Neisseria wadsworthii 9715]
MWLYLMESRLVIILKPAPKAIFGYGLDFGVLYLFTFFNLAFVDIDCAFFSLDCQQFCLRL